MNKNFVQEDFDYLSEDDVYLDAACQSLRPKSVIETLNRYYTEYNSCGERVKYPWGVATDRAVDSTREAMLKYLKLSPRKCFTAFTLNTTYGINLLLSQLDVKKLGIKQVVTTEIEHNSPFLATMSFAEKWEIPRKILRRTEDGAVIFEAEDLANAVVVLNATSNFNGMAPANLDELIEKTHKSDGLVLIDAAQTMAHEKEILEKTRADMICCSAHKMYAPSLGVMIIKRELLPGFKTSFVGGGMVDDVEAEKYYLSAERLEMAYTKFEAGLQAWGEIVALGEAIKWLEAKSKAEKTRLKDYAAEIFQVLSENPRIYLTGNEARTTMSFFVEGLDSHLLGAALAEQGIMTRTGYFCAHYFLDHIKKYPPLVRVSLGYHNRESDIKKFISAIQKL